MAILNILLVVTVLSWSIWGIFDKKALEKSSYQTVLICLHAFYFLAVLATLAAMNTLIPDWHLSRAVLFWTGLATVGNLVAVYVYVLVMARLDASFVLGITASYPLVTQLLAAIFLSEDLLFSRMIGAFLMAAGVAAISSSARSMSGRVSRSDWVKFLCCLTLATVCWGTVGLFDKKAILLADPLIVFYAHMIWGAVGCIIFYLSFRIRDDRLDFNSVRTWAYSGASSACMIAGFWTYLACLSMASASYVVTITSCYPLFMYLFALVLLKERFSRLRVSGIALVVIGTLVVQQSQQSDGFQSTLRSTSGTSLAQSQR